MLTQPPQIRNHYNLFEAKKYAKNYDVKGNVLSSIASLWVVAKFDEDIGHADCSVSDGVFHVDCSGDYIFWQLVRAS